VLGCHLPRCAAMPSALSRGATAEADAQAAVISFMRLMTACSASTGRSFRARRQEWRTLTALSLSNNPEFPEGQKISGPTTLWGRNVCAGPAPGVRIGGPNFGSAISTTLPCS
jgi:hypothetical protein